MIELFEITIDTTADYEKLSTAIDDPRYINDVVIKQLQQRIGTKVKVIILEMPYRDLDFSSVYCSHYSKKHKQVPKECYRLHFFSEVTLSQETYKGFLVLRPSLMGDSRGRAHLHPQLLAPKGSHLIVSDNFSAHIYGEKYKIRSFPWMAQETDIAICAHSAAWSIVRYFSGTYNYYKERSLSEIVDLAPPFINRKTPSEGLNLLQISTILSEAGFHPLFLNSKTHKETSFLDNLLIYIESGIPVIASVETTVDGKPFNHAICLIGHGKLNLEVPLDFAGKEFCLSTSFIDSIIAADDNHLPYVEVKNTSRDVKYNLEHITSAIVPLYEKMFLPSDVVVNRMKTLFESKALLPPDNPIIRPYITSTRSLKVKAQANESMNSELKNVLLQTPMPRFVWCVDICSVEEYNKGLCSSRVIFDSTAGTYDMDPFILSHDKHQIVFYDPNNAGWNRAYADIAPYELYRNNLKEVI